MNHSKIRIARILIVIPTLWYGIVPPLVDITESHVMNPDWPGHARFHMLWLLVTGSLLAITSLALIVKKIPDILIGTRLAGIITLCVYAGFFASFFTKGLYSGTMGDSGDLVFFGLDGNTLAFTPLALILLAGLYLIFTTRNAD